MLSKAKHPPVPRLKARYIVLGLVAAMGLLLAACGGGEATATPPPARPTSTTAPPTAQPTPTSAAGTPRPTATAVPAATATPAPPTATATGPRPKLGGTMRMRVSTPGFLNDFNVYKPGTAEFSVITVQNILNHLTALDAVDGNTIRSDLAETWAFAPDGKSIVYNLRKGVKWHDGTPFTAKDAAYSLSIAKSPTDPKATLHTARLTVVQSVDAPDDATLKITLSAPNAAFPTVMSIPAMLIFPAHIPDVAKTWNTTPIGTGPFKFKEYKTDTSLDLVRNEVYYKKDASGQSLPYLDGVKYTLIADRALTLSAFRSGQLDCACGYSSDIFPEDRDAVTKAIPGVKFGIALQTVNYLQFNSRPPLDNLKVRQAIHIAVDRVTAQQIYAQGTGLYPPTYFVPDKYGGKLTLSTDEFLKVPGFRVKDGKKDPADLELAKKLMADSGIDPSKVTLSFLTSGGTLAVLSELTSTLLSDAAKALGMTVKAVIATGPQQVEILLRGDFDLYNQPGPNSFDDPQDVLIPRNTTGGSLNYGKFSFPKVDQLSADQQRELDPAKRVELVKQLQRELLNVATFVPFNGMAPHFAAQPYVEGVALTRAFNITTGHRLETAWFNR